MSKMLFKMFCQFLFLRRGFRYFKQHKYKKRKVNTFLNSFRTNLLSEVYIFRESLQNKEN